MAASFRVACIQNCAEEHVDRNLARAEALVREAAAQGAGLVCLDRKSTRLNSSH